MTVKEAKEKFQEALQLLEDIREEFVFAGTKDLSVDEFKQQLVDAIIMSEYLDSELKIDDE